ncbi:hypothetical protein CM318V1_200103 [Carnobacterium maltaromaticum]|nr:hypothetical protein CM318V1_200103 [Carnobacterium maltaromaticum]
MVVSIFSIKSTLLFGDLIVIYSLILIKTLKKNSITKKKINLEMLFYKNKIS